MINFLSAFFMIWLFTGATTEAANSGVFIYYGNETHLNKEASKNYEVLKSWLDSDINGKGVKISKQLSSDLKKFSSATYEEVDILRELAPKLSHTNIVIFTNKLSSQNKMLYFRAGNNSVKSTDFKPVKADNYVLASHPNSSSVTFLNALKKTSELFSPKNHKFSLVTKSHGSSLFVMVPRLTITHETSSKPKLLDIVNARVKIDGIPPWMKGMGITRKEYFEVIESSGKDLGMNYNLVFVESCKSRTGIDKLTKLPSNISVLISPHINLDYKTIDYKHAFTRTSPTVDIAKQLSTRFSEDVAISKPNKSFFQKIFGWWVPLLVLVLLGSGYMMFKKD